MKKIALLTIFILLLLLTSCFKANRDGYYITYDYNDEFLNYFDNLFKTSDLCNHNYFRREIIETNENKKTYYMYSYTNEKMNEEICFLKRITIDKEVIYSECDVFQYLDGFLIHKKYDYLPEKVYSNLISKEKKEMEEMEYLNLYYKEQYSKYNLNLLNAKTSYIRHNIGYLIDEPSTYYYYLFDENEILYYELFDLKININNCEVCIEYGDGMGDFDQIVLISGSNSNNQYEIRICVGD